MLIESLLVPKEVISLLLWVLNEEDQGDWTRFRSLKRANPAPLLHICSVWEVQPNEVMMVGDSLKDDVSSALFLSPSFAPYLLRIFLIHFEVLFLLLVGNELEHLHACLTKQGGMILPNTQMWNLSQITRCLLLPMFIHYWKQILT
ncbi:Haloacid dehalogenase-like hydrolase domain-containing protein [Camellia lanceoleosa]|uniref:Haloacid dehalogenase-like hydrolase domain-containing protein n=1 Tax=Camellia lanceoleosa TaxID=1840588 RepID=A0ACC0F2G9_9ERIC|nr:Haloacid dehalogenase-like hydrolase domain-containing protein [Camellia lanceoleosa]